MPPGEERTCWSNIRGGLAHPRIVVDVKKVEGFSGIVWSAQDGLLIHAGATINDVLQDARVRSDFVLLAACAHDLASYQIRNRATVVGNVVNASPCSDMAPGLLCLQARAVISSRRGEREVPFKEFFKGVKKTVVRPDEVLERIVVPAASAGARGNYHKLKRINGHDLGIVGVAMCLGEWRGAPRRQLLRADADPGRGSSESLSAERWSRRS